MLLIEEFTSPGGADGVHGNARHCNMCHDAELFRGWGWPDLSHDHHFI